MLLFCYLSHQSIYPAINQFKFIIPEDPRVSWILGFHGSTGPMDPRVPWIHGSHGSIGSTGYNEMLPLEQPLLDPSWLLLAAILWIFMDFIRFHAISLFSRVGCLAAFANKML